MDPFTLAVAVIKSVLIVFTLLTGFAYATWFERKVIARMQARLGPNRAGPFGLLLPAADGLKLLFKENVRPKTSDAFTYFLAPVMSIVVAVAAFAVIPVSDPITLTFGGETRTIPTHLADFNIALLYVLGVTSLGVYGIVLAGWSSDNKYSLVGGLRSAAQMVIYELALGASLIGLVLRVAGGGGCSGWCWSQARSGWSRSAACSRTCGSSCYSRLGSSCTWSPPSPRPIGRRSTCPRRSRS